MIGEDIVELVKLADSVAAMSEGRVVFKAIALKAERQLLGAQMYGGHQEVNYAPTNYAA
jgi:general nucleoside transport system ATP-binding protein